MYGRSVKATWYAGLLLCGIWPQPGVSAEPPAVQHLASFSTGLYAPIRIAIDGAGNAYVTEPRKHRVSVLDASGNLLRTIHEVLDPLGIAVDRDNRLYIGDSRTGSVFVFGPDGSPAGVLGAGAGQFTMPTDIAIDDQGRIYVVDSKQNHVQVFDENGAFVLQFGEGLLTFPTGIVIDPAREQILVGQYGAIEDGKNAAKVQIFDRRGQWVRSIGQFGSEIGQFTRIQGLAIDGQGRVYVTDVFQSTVQVVDGAGEGLSRIGAFGTRPGQLNIPSDVALDPYNRLWVTSTENGCIELFGLDEFGWPGKDPTQTYVAAAEAGQGVEPQASVLLRNFPNPGNPETFIPFQLSQNADVVLEIRNTAGQLMRTLRLGRKKAGRYADEQRAARWDGRDQAGDVVASGVYFCTMRAGSFTGTTRMLILR